MKKQPKITTKRAIIVSKFNAEITSDMKKFAEKRSRELGMKVEYIIEVPGAFEIPFALSKVITEKVDGVAVIGAVVKGDTSHDELIVYSIAEKILELSIAYKKPVTFGVIGPNAGWDKAAKRKREYAERSIESLFEMVSINNRNL